MLFVRLRLFPFYDKPANLIDHLANWAKRLVRCVFVFLYDELVDAVQRSLANRGERARFIYAEDGVGEIEDRMVRSVNVDVANIVSLSRPIDGVVVLDIYLLRRTISTHKRACMCITYLAQR